jgi:antitoxin MazE
MYLRKDGRRNMATGTGTTVVKWENAPYSHSVDHAEGESAEGESVDFEVDAPGIVVVPVARVRPTLDDLVARITPQNRHAETEWGKAQGNEVW